MRGAKVDKAGLWVEGIEPSEHGVGTEKGQRLLSTRESSPPGLLLV